MQNLAGSAVFLPQGAHIFSLSLQVPPPRGFHGQIFVPDKHKIFAPNLIWLKIFAPEIQ